MFAPSLVGNTSKGSLPHVTGNRKLVSVIIFQPLSLQLLQQSLAIDFNQALANLGVNIVFLTYARSGVAVFLGAILAMTNVESEMAAQQESTPVATTPEQRQQAVKKLKLGNLDNQGKVVKVLELFPNISDRELGKLSGVSAVTAKKYRGRYNSQQPGES